MQVPALRVRQPQVWEPQAYSPWHCGSLPILPIPLQLFSWGPSSTLLSQALCSSMHRWGAHVDAEECSHAVQVVGVSRHGQHLGDDSGMGPLLPKLLYQLLQVAGGRLTDGIDYSRVKVRGRWFRGEVLRDITSHIPLVTQ